MIVRLTSLAAAIALSAALTACATTTPEIESGTSTEMQTTIVSIAESAAAGDPTTALTQLDALQQQLEAAIADGSVSMERATAIQTRIDVVRADLQPAPAPTVEPAPVEPAPETPVDDGGDDDGDDGGGNDNSGPGNNNGNGNSGKGKDKGGD